MFGCFWAYFAIFGHILRDSCKISAILVIFPAFFSSLDRKESSDLADVRIKYGTFSGTTDVGGDVALGVHIDNVFIVGIWCPGVSYMFTPKAISGGAWYTNVQKYDSQSGSLVLVKNTAISGRYYYTEL